MKEKRNCEGTEQLQKNNIVGKEDEQENIHFKIIQ